MERSPQNSLGFPEGKAGNKGAGSPDVSLKKDLDVRDLALKSESETGGSRGMGRKFERFFTKEGVHPFDTVEWEKRDVAINNDRGEAIFEQKGVKVPKFWSQTAINVVASKYFAGGIGTPEREQGVDDLISRVADTISSWGRKDGYFASSSDAEAFQAELTHILLNQYASFNSPVWFNVGVREHPQCSACFILAVEDSMDSLLELQTTEGRLFKYGSGTGTNLSTIRSSRESLSGGGTPSGPVSFMRAFDGWANIIKSGGKTRRAAKMQILNATHPDIMEFIRCKADEEKKAWDLIEQGYDGGFAVPGGAYDSVSFQNANLSVRVTDDFMNAVENGGTYNTVNVADGKPCQELNAKDVLKAICEGTYICGDPGLQFDTTINNWHTCASSGRINSSNPCSEYMHLDNSACNLSSINLLKFLREDNTFDVDAYLHCVDVMITAQDMLVDNASYPTKKIEKCARDFRQLGLGYSNLGALLMCLGMPYDSPQGREWAEALTSLMTGQAYLASTVLAEKLGPFNGYRKNAECMLKVMKQHKECFDVFNSAVVPDSLTKKGKEIWKEAVERGRVYGYRNSQATVLAPTGTISFMMDCDTTGIEPDIALVKYKKLVGGGLLKLVNNSVKRGLKSLGYSGEEIANIVNYIDEHDTIEGAPDLKDEHLPVFDCAFKAANGTRSIGYMGHLKMMGAAQPYISGAISKTVNLPKDCTVEEIYQTYLESWKLGLKAVALYRDGSKRTQPLSTSTGKDGVLRKPVRRHLPDERQAVTHKFSVGGLEGYLTVGLYDDGTPGEVFLVVAKEGSTLSGIMDAFATSVSIALQYGVPLSALVRKFSHMRFEPSGFTQNKEIPMAKSIIDYVFRWLGKKFLTQKEREELGLEGKVVVPNARKQEEHEVKALPKAAGINGNGSVPKGGRKAASKRSGDTSKELRLAFHNMEDAPPCTSCGSSLMVRQGACYVCLNCGAQGGCG